MMESINCRLCLKTCKRVKPLNDSKNGVPYWLMIHSISDIKLSQGDLDEKACVSCCRRLEDAYNFKLLIESSDTSLQNSNTKRINFNNIEDIKTEIEIPDYEYREMQESLVNNIEIDEKQFTYHDTLIKRVDETERKPMCVGEYLSYIKEESEDEGCEVDNLLQETNYEPPDESENPDSSDYDQYDVPLNKRKTRNNIYNEIKPRVTRSTKKLRNDDVFDEDYFPPSSKNYMKLRKNLTGNEFKKPIGRPSQCRILPVPIQPQVLDNIRLSNIKEPRIKRPKLQKICYHCGKLCNNLESHLLTHTNVESKYKCDKCPKVYRKIYSLKYHQKRHDPKTIKCEHCVATFSLEKDYLSHLRYHTDEKNFVCDLCSKAFRRKAHLKNHLSHTHNIGVKEYKCDRCEKVCKSSDLLKHHYRVHTRERPYNCQLCTQPYSYKHDFNRHCLNKHGVLFKHRSVYVLNEEVLLKERTLMSHLMLRINGVDKNNLPDNPFDGPQGHFAYQYMIKYLETKQLPVDFQL